MGSFDYWLLFFSAALLINLAPGPDLFLIIAKTTRFGIKTGLVTTLGTCSGAMMYVVATATGLSVIFNESNELFRLVSYAGAVYLIWLGVQSAFFSNKPGSENEIDQLQVQHRTHLLKVFWQGFLVDLLNPKVALFFVAFLPQFYRPGYGALSSQLFWLGSLVVIIAMVIEFSVVISAAKTQQLFQSRPRLSLWLNRIPGLLLIVIGLRLIIYAEQDR